MYSSRLVKIAVLFSLEEIRELFAKFSTLKLFNTAAVCEKGETEVSLELFYDNYSRYLDRAKKKEEYLTPYLTVGANADNEALMMMDVGQGRVLLRPKRPLIQIRPYHFSIQEGGKIIPMAFQKEKFFWGLEFSYPQLFAPSRDAPIQRIWRNPDFPNSLVFIQLLKWIYKETELVTPFRVGKKMKDEDAYRAYCHWQ
jgi:hypothetical protein